MSADRFRLAVFVLAVVVVAAAAWAGQWRYSTNTQGEPIRFSVFTGVQETLLCGGIVDGTTGFGGSCRWKHGSRTFESGECERLLSKAQEHAAETEHGGSITSINLEINIAKMYSRIAFERGCGR